jgi:hypothetical protein
MKIAVIGGGIFGVTAAIRLAKNHNVDLFEKNSDILQNASGINQYRLHRGYHYPRSTDTALSSLKSEILFRNEFAEAIIDHFDHYYCISKYDSLTSRNEYLDFCREINLDFKEVNLDVVNNSNISLTIKAKECLFDPNILKMICWQKLKSKKVNVFLNNFVTEDIFNLYDKVIVSTYANTNFLLKHFPNFIQDFQFEICEKPIVTLPSAMDNKSIVIMDGPFMCVDPFGHSNQFVLGNVVHAIHHTNTGQLPEISKDFESVLNKGIIKNPPITNFKKFQESGSDFFPLFEKASHVGSMFTIRTVLPKIEDTDARPTIVRKISDNVISIFSGKIGNCVAASHQVEKMIENQP